MSPVGSLGYGRENDIEVTIIHDELNEPLEIIPNRQKVKRNRDRDFSSEL
jgi:hypothetical protein